MQSRKAVGNRSLLPAYLTDCCTRFNPPWCSLHAALCVVYCHPYLHTQLGRYTIHNEPVEKLHKVVQAFGFKRIVVNDDDTISDNSSSNSSLKQPAIGNAASSSSSVGISSLSSSSAANQGVQPSSEVQAQVATGE